MDHYFQGGFYPMGGGGAIIKAMTNKIKSFGGEVKTSSSVARILLEGDLKKKAVGVELGNGEKIFAEIIVSNADPDITYRRLIGTDNLSKKLIRKLDRTKYSCTSLMLFLTVDMDVKSAGLDSGNIWMMADGDMDEIYNEMLHPNVESDEAFPGMFISCTTLKDPISFDGKHHTIEAITYIDYEVFKAFENEDFERSQEYSDFKELMTRKMLNTIEKAIPGIKEHIVHLDMGTPITNEYYINSTAGSVYGTEKSLKHIGPFAFKAKSEIENLYLCGASIASHGIAGASYSGVQTAGEILGKKQADLIQMDPDQDVRIFSAEDPSDYPEWMLKKIAVKEARLASSVKT